MEEEGKAPVYNEESRFVRRVAPPAPPYSYRGTVPLTSFALLEQPIIAMGMYPGLKYLGNGQVLDTRAPGNKPTLGSMATAFATRHQNPNVGYMGQSMSYNANPANPYGRAKPATKPATKTQATRGWEYPGFNVPMTDAQGNIIGDTGFGPFGPPVPEAQGTANPPPPEVGSGEGYSDYGYPSYGGGGYYGGGGGGSYTQQGYPFNAYQQGYAMQGTPAQAAPGLRTAGQAQYQGYAQANQAQRWLQLLTNWRI
jgi:hypothetical protein